MNATRKSRALYGNRVGYGGALARFATTPTAEPVERSHAALPVDNEAVIEGRTIFTSRVFDASERDRVLISGINNAKIGKAVTKGAWAGMPIYTLSLEERATCPRSCVVWRECYGNGMPMAVRFRYTPRLMAALSAELTDLNRRHRKGFVIRLHVLGDFPDLLYLKRWLAWLAEFSHLHVWGYTAHDRDGEIGELIRLANGTAPERWAVRFSTAEWKPLAPMQVSTIWQKPETLSVENDALVCPQEAGKTQTCGTCGLCWNPAAAHLRVLFMGHGGRGKRA